MTHSCFRWAVYCPFDLSFILLVSRPDGCTDKIVKTTHRRNSKMKWNKSRFRPPLCTYRRRNSNGYRPSLCSTAILTRQKRDNNPVLFFCWVSVADDSSIWIDIGLTSRVCCRRGVLWLFARLPLIKPYKLRGSFMFTFWKVLCNRYCNMKALQLYFNWSGEYIVSHVVLKWLQTRRIIKIQF